MTRRRLWLVGLATSVSMSTALLVLGMWPAGAAEQRTVTTVADAWYATSPLCGVPVACGSGASTTTSYPPDTLHVAMTGGQEAARSYIAFAPTAIPATTRATSGLLILPLAADAGTASAETGAITVCLVPAGLPSPAPAAAPATDCKVSSPASYVQGTPDYYSADLGPFLKHGLDGLTLALIPTPVTATSEVADTWHAAFSGHARKAPGVQHIVAQVSLTTIATAAPTTPSTAPTTAPVSTGAVPPASGPINLPSMPVSSTTEPAAPPQVASATPVTPAVRPAVFSIKGGKYGMVWTLPLALFFIGWAFASTGRRTLRSYAPRSWAPAAETEGQHG